MQPYPTILHVDMDSFYVSVERLLDPSLVGKPVVVGGRPDSRGVVASASYEARRFGVRSAMPSAQAYRLCPQAVFVSGGYGKYSEYSRKIRAVLERMTPLVQFASQDEAYLDMTGTERLWGAPVEMGRRVREAILADTGLPCSVGIGTNKMIAKIASSLCKPKGMLWVPAGSEERFLAPLDVGEIPGLGPKSQKRLHELGIRRVGDLQALGAEGCRRLFGDHGEELFERAMGRLSSVVATEEEAKSISHETTFEQDVASGEELEAVLLGLSERVAARVRRDGVWANTIGIKFRYANFETHTAARSLSTPTRDDRTIFRTAVELLRAKWDARRALRLVGVACSNLTDECGQMDLLGAGEDSARREKLLEAIDALREKHGTKAIRSAGGLAGDDTPPPKAHA